MTATTGVSSVERLLDAAAGAFADRGYAATTTRDIAARAGLSPAGVYVHFGSKEALLHALSMRGHEAALDLVTRSVAGPGPASARVARVMGAFSAWHAEHHEMARVVQYEFGHLTPDHHAEVVLLRRRIDHTVRTVLEDGVAAGELQLTDVRETALALLSLCIDVARWYSPTSGRTPSGIGATYATLGQRLLTP
ncbi:MAG: TetR/AcrR family transcriptional regulator [Lapillicoccus sp.]